jgi:hypothetical protein
MWVQTTSSPRSYSVNCVLNDAVKFINYTTRSWMYQIKLWSTGGVILAGEHRSTRRQTSDSATSSTTNPTWNETVLNPGPHEELPVTTRLSFNIASSYRDLCVSVNVDSFQKRWPSPSKAMDHSPSSNSKRKRTQAHGRGIYI